MDNNIHNRIQESIDELSSDYSTFDEYKKGLSQNNTLFVYSQVGKEAIPNICLNGTEGSKEFLQTMCYGRGIYTVLTYNECISYKRCDAMVIYAVKRNAFNNFLFFDYNLRDHLFSKGFLRKKEKLHETVRRLFNDSDYSDLERRFGHNLSYLENSIERGGHTDNAEYEFWDYLKGNRTTINNYSNSHHHYDEYKLDANRVDGFAYNSGYGHTLIFRTSDLLMPYKYVTKRSVYDHWPSLSEFKYCFNNEENFNSANFTIDGYRRCRREYPDTNFSGDKTVSGFHIIRNKSKNKFNFLNARTHKLLSPLDFDKCEAFDPIEGTAIASVFTEEEGEIVFKFVSNNFGENVDVFWLDPETKEWNDLSYDDFCGTMNELKQERGQINESVDEVYTTKSYDEFFSDENMKHGFRVWKAMPPSVVPNVLKHGISKEFSGNIRTNPHGDNSLYYGLTAYSVRDKNSLLGGKYGQGIVEFVIKGGIRGFLIFDKDLRNKVEPGKSVYDEIIELVPNKEDLKTIDRNLRNNYNAGSFINNRGLDAFKSDPPGNRTAGMAKAFFEAAGGQNAHNPDVPYLRDENILSRSKIRGYIYTGDSDGKCVAPRDFNSLMPVAYSLDGGRTWKRNKEAMTREDFDFINNDVDVNFLHRGDYPKVGIYDKQTGGYAFVTDNEGHINYMDIRNQKPLLPIDADNGIAFDALEKNAEFTLCGVRFKIDASCGKPVLYYEEDSGFEMCSYEDLLAFIQQAKDEYGLLQGRREYKDCILAHSGNQQPLNEADKPIGFKLIEAIPDIMLLQNNGLPIFKEPVSEEELNEIASNRKLIKQLLDDDELFTDEQAYNFFVSRLKSGVRTGDNIYRNKIVELKAPERQQKQEEIDAKKASKESEFSKRLKTLNAIFKAKLGDITLANGTYPEFEEIVNKLNEKYKATRPLIYSDVSGIYIPMFAKEYNPKVNIVGETVEPVMKDLWKMGKNYLKSPSPKHIVYEDRIGVHSTKKAYFLMFYPANDSLYEKYGK